MSEYMTIMPAPHAAVPPELALLTAQVELTPPKPNPQPVPSYPRDHAPVDDPPAAPQRVGHVTGVVFDLEHRLSHYLVELSDDHRSVLVPVFAANIFDERGTPVIQVPWTATQLAAQPRLNDKNELPADYEEHPLIWWKGNTPIPPGGDLFEAESGAKEAAVAGGTSAAIGAIIGTLVGGPIVGAGLALFFGLGGGIAGGMTGGSREDSADAKWLYKAGDEKDKGTLDVFERRLLNPELYDSGLLQARKMTVHGPKRPLTRAVDHVLEH